MTNDSETLFRELEIIHRVFDSSRETLERLRQLKLLDQREFLAFAHRLGFSELSVPDWVFPDASNGSNYYHHFRTYVLHARSTATLGSIARDTDIANGIANLAILLEPIFWPQLVGTHSRSYVVVEDEFSTFRKKTIGRLIRELDPIVWGELHEHIRFQASYIDNNPSLYLLLRLSTWDQRTRLNGRVGAALWLRHIAEVIRRGFEVFHEVKWLEEYEAFGIPGDLPASWGLERPLDAPFRAMPYVVKEFGLLRGSVVRWYVEGDTEYHTICELLPNRETLGIELYNLKGGIEKNRNNVALKLRDLLKEDLVQQRFSMISIDDDVDANKKAIQAIRDDGLLIGLEFLHHPDFEFSNFSLQELQEVAGRIADEFGKGEEVRCAEWSAVKNGRELERKYWAITRQNLKGKKWGIALAQLIKRAHFRPDCPNEPRPICEVIRRAKRMRKYDYNAQKDHQMRIKQKSASNRQDVQNRGNPL